MKKIINWVCYPPVTGQSSILIVRFMVGSMFGLKGLLQFTAINREMGLFLRPESPAITANFIASMEIIGGAFLVFGLLTRLTTLYFIVEIIVANITANINLHISGTPLLLPAASVAATGLQLFNALAPGYAQLLSSLFLILEGPGRRSLDFKFFTTRKVYTMNRE